jgi:hypothetical protein
LWTLLHGLRPFYDDHSATAGDYFCDTAWRWWHNIINLVWSTLCGI